MIGRLVVEVDEGGVAEIDLDIGISTIFSLAVFIIILGHRGASIRELAQNINMGQVMAGRIYWEMGWF